MIDVRFRTLGCIAHPRESDGTTLPAIIQEMLMIMTSERQGRVTDRAFGSIENTQQGWR